MTGGLGLGQTRVGKTVLHGVEKCRIARVVQIGAEHHTDSLRVQGIDQFAELGHRAVILVNLGIVERVIAVIAVMREVVYRPAPRHPAVNLFVDIGHPHNIHAQVGEIPLAGFLQHTLEVTPMKRGGIKPL